MPEGICIQEWRAGVIMALRDQEERTTGQAEEKVVHSDVPIGDSLLRKMLQPLQINETPIIHRRDSEQAECAQEGNNKEKRVSSKAAG